MKEYSQISVVIPCYQTPVALVTKLIRSLGAPGKNLEIVVVESGERLITQKVLPKVRLIYSRHRLNCAQAINLGVKKCSHEFVCNANPDIAGSQETLPQLVNYLKAHPLVGIVAPQVMRSGALSKQDLPGLFNHWTGNVETFSPLKLNRSTKEIPVDIVSGCLIVFRKSIWKKTGGLDENYFLYWEDADFCMKVRKLARDIIWLPAVSVEHPGGTGSDASRDKIYYLVRNGLIFKMRWANLFGKAVTLCGISLTLLVKLIKVLIRKDIENRRFIKGIIDFLTGLKGILPI